MAATRPPKEENAVWETVSVIIQALLLAVVLRTFLFQPFNIPSGSMKPTLLVGDYIFVSKWSYGYSKHSFPFSLGPFEGRVWEGIPERGDVVVFKYPNDTSKDYIKRVIGLPGDTVQMRDSVVYVNDKAVTRGEQGVFVDEGSRRSTPIYIETQDSGRSYETIDFDPGTVADNTEAFVVPEAHYFFLGDNRDNSADSRFDVGMVPAENLVGKAQVIFLSLKDGTPAWQIWNWPSDMRWDRIFKGL
ncbi:signal peptidase I [Ahrensia sp. R2A130]|uniref:signal peptidase I n=1 Tax=Ahrensia sp. R2A130 TaxID=744979 RepID=UPI0001E0A44A|nr:signal peptidase I [Ahrensia sp. R2A130]EFL90658.1 signal peptidase I [Ahrensia sp. R2A130]